MEISEGYHGPYEIGMASYGTPIWICRSSEPREYIYRVAYIEDIHFITDTNFTLRSWGVALGERRYAVCSTLEDGG